MRSVPPCLNDARLWPAVGGDDPDPAVRRHLDGCRPCRQRLERLRNEQATLRRSGLPFAADTAPQPPPTDIATPVAGPEAADEDPPLERIGRYPVLEAIGAGGQADLFAALHPALGCTVTIKLSRTRVQGEARAALEREGRILAAIQHPYLARVLDLDFHGDRPFLVLEAVEGATLAAVHAQRPLTPSEMARCLEQLAEAVQAVHDAGVLHLDLKPENVLVRHDGQVQLIDFGAAQWRHALGRDTTDAWIIGTPGYMAPEQLQGDPTGFGPSTDVYGLGGILQYLLAGEVSPQQAQVCEGEEQTAAPAPRGRPMGRDTSRVRSSQSALRGRLAQIAARALHPEPAQRYPSARDFQRALAQATAAISSPRRMASCFLAGLGLASLMGAGGLWSGHSVRDVVLEVQVIRDDEAHMLSASLPFVTGTPLYCTIQSPDAIHTELWLIRSDGAELLCQPLVPAAASSHTLHFPPESETWGLRGVSELQLLVAGIPHREASAAVTHWAPLLKEAGRSLATDQNWLRLRNAGSRAGQPEPDPWRRAGLAPEAADRSLFQLAEALDRRFTQYDAILFRGDGAAPPHVAAWVPPHVR